VKVGREAYDQVKPSPGIGPTLKKKKKNPTKTHPQPKTQKKQQMTARKSGDYESRKKRDRDLLPRPMPESSTSMQKETRDQGGKKFEKKEQGAILFSPTSREKREAYRLLRTIIERATGKKRPGGKGTKGGNTQI